jgi:cAMP-dependent protein kinase regulator
MFKREFADGAVIIKQGDQPDNFYILLSGSCKVFKKSGEEEKLVATLGPGSYFGELAMISGSTRSASVIAEGELTVTWAIDQLTYLALLKEHHEHKRRRYQSLLSKVACLHGLQDYELLLVADALNSMDPEEGTVLMKQGDIGEDFFIILEGTCTVRKRKDGEEEREVERLGAGSYFGELALLTDLPRAATVIAGQNCKLVKLDKKNFLRLLGPHSSVFDERISLYALSHD